MLYSLLFLIDSNTVVSSSLVESLIVNILSKILERDLTSLTIVLLSGVYLAIKFWSLPQKAIETYETIQRIEKRQKKLYRLFIQELSEDSLTIRENDDLD